MILDGAHPYIVLRNNRRTSKSTDITCRYIVCTVDHEFNQQSAADRAAPNSQELSADMADPFSVHRPHQIPLIGPLP
jgi:hypothetical protein